MSWFASLFRRSTGHRASATAGEYAVAEPFVGLRSQILGLRPSDIGLAAQSGDPIALLMEMGGPEAVATLVAVADGTTSLYFSNGGGILGSGAYDDVRPATAAFLTTGAAFAPALSPVDDYPLPAPGRIRFYLVAGGGVSTAEASESDLGNNRHRLSPLFFKGHEVIAAIRQHAPT